MFRVEEFQRQLDWMHQNVTSTSEKVSELHIQTQRFKELFDKIDQIEVRKVWCFLREEKLLKDFICITVFLDVFDTV